MFSKFLRGKDSNTLAALKMQWDMEFAKANRKFDQEKKQKKKSGRPPLGQLMMNTLNGDGKSVDLTKIARNVATTREGRRRHKKMMGTMDGKDGCNRVCFPLLVCCVFFVCLLAFFFMIFAFFIA